MSSIDTYLEVLRNGNDERAEAVVKPLAEMGEVAFPELAVLLEDGSAHERWWAARTLAELDLPQATELLLGALSDSDESVQECAVLSLGVRQDPKAVGALVPLLGGPSGMLARLAVDALVKIGRPAVAQLVDVLRDPNPSVRSGAARALASIADPDSIPALFSALEDDSALVQYWANIGLDKMGAGQVYFRPG